MKLMAGVIRNNYYNYLDNLSAGRKHNFKFLSFFEKKRKKESLIQVKLMW